MVEIIGSTPKAQVEDYRRQMDRIGRGYVRGVIFSLNGVAKEAQKRIRDKLPKVIDQPIAFTRRGIGRKYAKLDGTRVPSKALDNVASQVMVLHDQSTYMKYLFGTGTNIRRPGDVGPGETRIYKPNWDNLKAEGIKPVAGQSLGKNSIKMLARRANRPILGKKGKFTHKGDSRSTKLRDAKAKPVFWLDKKTGKLPAGIYTRPKRAYLGADGRVQLRDTKGRFIGNRIIKGRRKTTPRPASICSVLARRSSSTLQAAFP